jgi:hypothetical protein
MIEKVNPVVWFFISLIFLGMDGGVQLIGGVMFIVWVIVLWVALWKDR